MRDQLRVTIPMADVLFRALKRHGRASDMVDAARLGARIIRDGTSRGLLNLDTRTSAQILLLGWCQQEEVDLPLASLTLTPASQPSSARLGVVVSVGSRRPGAFVSSPPPSTRTLTPNPPAPVALTAGDARRPRLRVHR